MCDDCRCRVNRRWQMSVVVGLIWLGFTDWIILGSDEEAESEGVLVQGNDCSNVELEGLSGLGGLRLTCDDSHLIVVTLRFER